MLNILHNAALLLAIAAITTLSAMTIDDRSTISGHTIELAHQKEDLSKVESTTEQNQQQLNRIENKEDVLNQKMDDLIHQHRR